MKISETFEEERVQDQPKIAEFCDGCLKIDMEEMKCSIYAYVPHLYRTHNECPFNPVKREAVRGKIRVGQGKTKSGGNR